MPISAALSFEDDGLERLSRQELQQKAKELGIRANQKSTELIVAIRDKLRDSQIREEQTAGSSKDYRSPQSTSVPVHNPVTPKTPAFGGQRRMISSRPSSTSESKEMDDDLADEAPAPFLGAENTKNGSPKFLIQLPSKEESIKNAFSIPASSRSVRAQGVSPKAGAPTPSAADGTDRARLLARVNERLSPPKSFAPPPPHAHQAPSSFETSTGETLRSPPFSAMHQSSRNPSSTSVADRRLINPRPLFRNPDALTGVRRVSISATPISTVKSGTISESSTSSEVKTPGRLNENKQPSNETANLTLSKTPASVLKEAMRAERERRRQSRALEAVDQHWEQVESRSKPGQFYFWNPVTQRASWELPPGVRINTLPSLTA